ncbi:MAG: hypothetical protein Q9213_002572 [Squamulea squamosa]
MPIQTGFQTSTQSASELCLSEEILVSQIDFLSGDSAGHWVLIFDNADDINLWIDNPKFETQQSTRLIDYIPRSKNGRVIFTTRDRKVGVKLAHQNVIEVPQVTEDTATRMLRGFLIDKDLVDSRPADTKQCLHGSPISYWLSPRQPRFQESKVLGLRAVEAQKRILGEEDPETLSTMSHLAMTYFDLSQWKEAEELELQTMELRMRVLRGEHPDTLIGMSNLVYLHNCQGWWKQAEELGKQVTSARKKVLDIDHPDTLLSVGNLAHTYNNQGRYKDAEELLVQGMNVLIRVLGKNHPHTLSGMSNLAVSYHNQGQLGKAEALQAQVVAARKVLLGPEHFSSFDEYGSPVIDIP